MLRRQRVILGRLLRDVERKITDELKPALAVWIERAWRIQRQRPHDSNKLYAMRAPEVECIGKGKSRQPFEFGVKVSLAVTHKSGFIVGARSVPGNPYDGHTLASQIEQTNVLLQGIGVKPTTAVVDLGYRGVDHLVKVAVVHRGRYKTMTDQQRRWIKRRQAIEPVIGHARNDHGMRQCRLKGSGGDALDAVLCAAGFNIRWLLRAIARGGIAALMFVLQLLALMRGCAEDASSGAPRPHLVTASMLGRDLRGDESREADQVRGHVMTEDIESIAKRLVVGHKRDGRSIYDPQARRDLVKATSSLVHRWRALHDCAASTPTC